MCQIQRRKNYGHRHLWPDGALHIGDESGFASEDSRTPGFLVIPQLLLLSGHLLLKIVSILLNIIILGGKDAP